MLLAFKPATLVLSAIRPFKDSISLLFVLDVVATVLTAVLEVEHSPTMHHVAFPFSNVLSTVFPNVGSFALHLVIDEEAIEGAAILPLELAFTMFLAVLILTFVDGAVLPHLKTAAMVLIILPLARILCAIGVGVSTCTMHAAILPVADVYISFRLYLASEAILHVIEPESFVCAAVLEYKLSFAVPETFNPFSSILTDLPVDKYLGLAFFWDQTGVGEHFQTLDICILEIAISLQN